MNSYLTFIVSDEVFALHVSNVMEIREYEEPKGVPQKVNFVVGLIEFRDEVIPVINTGLKFNLPPVKISTSTIIVILNLTKPGEDEDFRVAILVDAVSDVIDISDEALKPIRNEYKPGYVAGTFSKDDVFVLVLDSNQVFTENEVVEMNKILKAAKK
jgi:purine-binding chemotaxis protein CheW